MKSRRIESTIRYAGYASRGMSLMVICLAGVVAIASAQEQISAAPPGSVAAMGEFKGGLDLHLPDMPFAQRPGAGKSVLPDRWAWIEGCHRFVEARFGRDAEAAGEIGDLGPTGETADETGLARYQRRRLLADCLVSASR